MMDSSKSQTDFYVDLCSQLIADDPLHTTPHRSLLRDIQTLRSRVKSEGLSFLTKTLPKLGKALDQGLTSLKFSIPREFKHSHENVSIPAFLQAYFNLIFCATGELRPDAPAEAVKHLRQVLFFAYKLEIDYSISQKDAVMAKFKEVDDQLEFAVTERTEQLLALCARITETVFGDFDPKDILPRHGPGAVATGERLEEKWEFSRLYSGIHQYYPYYDYFMVGRGRELQDRLGWYKSLLRQDSGVARVVLVPKDSRGPRLISAEPLEYQWIQQGLGRKLASFLERDSSLTRKRVNFEDQGINRRLALRNSITQRYATLDLNDASDRVSLVLVQRVFENTPKLLRALEATRSSATILPDGSMVRLKKFAPMGSALCFPVEAYIFWVLLVADAVLDENLPLKKAASRVYVYGDDIIIPTKWALRSMQTLESVGLKVNRQKSCITGSFRESCGMDAFKGVPVTPIRLKKQYSNRTTDGTVLSSYSSIANSLASSGYVGTSSIIRGKLEETYGKLPYGSPQASFPCIEVSSAYEAELKNSRFFKSRWNRRYQRLEFRVSRVIPIKRESKLDGWPRALRDLVSPMLDEPSVVVVPRSTQIKRGWTAMF